VAGPVAGTAMLAGGGAIGLAGMVELRTARQPWANDPGGRSGRTFGAHRPAPPDPADPPSWLADMTGDGLDDIVMLRSGNVVYRPNLGRGRWGDPVTMRRSPRLPDGYDERRMLFGDVNGDGAADLVYVDNGRVLLWDNQSGIAWSDQPLIIQGTPSAAGSGIMLLCDLYGTGMAGLLLSSPAGDSGPHLRFLDLAAGAEPHLPPTGVSPRPSNPAATCVREGRQWRIMLGRRSVLVAHGIGMFHLAVLLANANVEIPALELAAGVTAAGGAHERPSMPAQAVLDRSAIQQYRQQLTRLQEEIEELESSRQPERAARARTERDWIIAELRTGTGLGGRTRGFPDSAERARIAVGKAIRRAITRIHAADQLTGDHLRRSVHTGMRCAYYTA
jgi:hypothetical protein